MLDGRVVDCLPFMPITMMFAADRIGVKYGQYIKDYRVWSRPSAGWPRSSISTSSRRSPTPRARRGLRGAVEFFEDQPAAIIEHKALLADTAKLAHLKVPDRTPVADARPDQGHRAVQAAGRRPEADRGLDRGPCAEGRTCAH